MCGRVRMPDGQCAYGVKDQRESSAFQQLHIESRAGRLRLCPSWRSPRKRRSIFWNNKQPRLQRLGREPRPPIAWVPHVCSRHEEGVPWFDMTFVKRQLSHAAALLLYPLLLRHSLKQNLNYVRAVLKKRWDSVRCGEPSRIVGATEPIRAVPCLFIERDAAGNLAEIGVDNPSS